MRFYIAGPMSGYKNWNFPAFDRAKQELLANGHWPLSPADLDRFWGLREEINTLPDWFDRADALLRDFELIKHSDGIYLLEGWSDSSGAKAEVAFAEAIGKAIYLEVKGVPNFAS